MDGLLGHFPLEIVDREVHAGGMFQEIRHLVAPSIDNVADLPSEERLPLPHLSTKGAACPCGPVELLEVLGLIEEGQKTSTHRDPGQDQSRRRDPGRAPF